MTAVGTGCDWTVQNDESWLTIQSGGGTTGGTFVMPHRQEASIPSFGAVGGRCDYGAPRLMPHVRRIISNEKTTKRTMAETLGRVSESEAQAVYAVADEEFRVMESWDAAAYHGHRRPVPRDVPG